MTYCDKCGSKKKKTRRLELGSGSGMSLCNPCLKDEIKWRKMRNKTLTGKAQFRTKYKF